MAITMDGIFVNGQKVTFHPENILSGDASVYTEEIGTAVEAWMEENVTGGEQVTDTTLTLPGVPADAEVTGNKIDELKEDFSDAEAKLARTPSMLNSDSESNLDVADAQGNVILRLADGEIQTKNFNSANVLTDEDLADVPKTAETEEDDPNLDVADVYGNVLVRVENGELRLIIRWLNICIFHLIRFIVLLALL